MKFVIAKSVLVDALNVLPSLPSNIIPILNTVHIDANEKLTLTATDSVILTQTSKEAEVKEKGTACVPLRNFLSLVKEMPAGDLTIETTKSQLHVKNGGVKLRMNMFDSAEFPSAKFTDTAEHEVTIDSGELYNRLSATAIAMGSSIGFDINGMLVNVTKNGVTFVATDGKRLAVSEDDAEVLSKYVVPARTINEWIKVAELSEEPVQLTFNKGCVTLNTQGIYIRTLLLENKYPDYKKFIPAENKVKLVVNRLQFIEGLKRTNILTNDVDNPLKIVLSKDSLEITRRNPNLGDIEENMTVDYKGQDLTLGFEVKCLIDVLEIIEDEKVAVDIYSPDKPFVVRKNDYLYLALPIIL